MDNVDHGVQHRYHSVYRVYQNLSPMLLLWMNLAQKRYIYISHFFFFLNSIKSFKLAISNYMHPFISSLSHLEIAKTKKKKKKGNFHCFISNLKFFFLKVHRYIGQEPSGRLFNEICLDHNRK